MRRRLAGHPSAARMVAVAAAALLVGGLGAATAAHGGGSSPKVSSHPLRAEETSAVYSGPEFSRPSASQYQQPPVSAADYQFCLKQNYNTGLGFVPYSGYVSGYANAEKQNGSAAAGYPQPSLMTGTGPGGYLSFTMPNGNEIYCLLVKFQLDYDGKREFPPMRATFRAFGFMPVTATVTLAQQGTAPISTVLYTVTGNTNTPTVFPDSSAFNVVAAGNFVLRLSDVTVDGAPLNVGSGCQTKGILTTPQDPAAPNQVALVGGGYTGDPVPWYAQIQSGGAVSGLVDIPPLTNCVTPSGENLDALLTSAVSGPGNYVYMVQDATCNGLITECEGPGDNLPPDSPPLYDVSNGGHYSATGPVTIASTQNGDPDATAITCATSGVSGMFPDIYGPLRAGFASMNWNLGDCTSPAPSGSGSISWAVTQIGTAQLAGAELCDSQSVATCAKPAFANDLIATIDNLSFELKEVGGTNCHLDLDGWQEERYTASGGGVLEKAAAYPAGLYLWATNSTCGDYFPNSSTQYQLTDGLEFTYTLNPSDITITPIIP
jgi:hypothetical protein